MRSADGETCVVLLNTAAHDQSIGLDLPAGRLRVLLSSHARPPAQDARDDLRLAAHEVYIAQLV